MSRHVLPFILFLGALGCRKESRAPAGEPEKTAGKTAEPEKKAEEAPHTEGHVEFVKLSPEAVRTAQIQIVEARRKALSQGLVVPARITFPKTAVSVVSARVSGRLSGLAVELGQTVKTGAILGYLESPELGQARADYLSAATKARVAENNYLREQDLLKKGITSERETREAESAFVTAQADRNASEARLHTLGLSEPEIRALKRDEHYSSRFPLRSPIDGTVVDIQGAVGQAVESTTPLFTVGSLTELWALLDVFEAQLPRLRVGQPVTVTVPAVPDRRFTGTIQYIGDIVEEKSRAVQVRVAVPNPDRALKPGMFASAEVATTAGGDAGIREAPHIVVPRQSVQKIGAEQFVFTPVAENQFKAVEVRVGISSAAEVEILSGIEPGARVVSQGAFILKSELSKESLGEEH